MNKINPLYLLLFFVLVVLLMIYKVSETETQINEVIRQNAHFESDGKEISGLKNRWKDSDAVVKRIDTILSLKNFSSQISKRDKTKTGYKIVLEGLDNVTLDAFTNKLLNESIAIKSIEIERISETNATISVECEL